MKKSQSITLTVIASMGMAASAQQAPPAPAAPAAPLSCEEQRKAARASGSPVAQACGHGHSGVLGAIFGGFGSNGKVKSGGG